MTSATKRNLIGWGIVAAIILFFAASIVAGGSTQMMIAATLFFHLPVFIVPCRIVFSEFGLTSISITRAIFRGWMAFVGSGLLWWIGYHTLYRKFNWPVPDLPGEFLAGIFFGWWPALIVIGFAIVIRLALKRFTNLFSYDHSTA